MTLLRCIEDMMYLHYGAKSLMFPYFAQLGLGFSDLGFGLVCQCKFAIDNSIQILKHPELVMCSSYVSLTVSTDLA